MPKTAFSDVGLRSIKLPAANGAADYWDERFPSFGLRVSQRGTKTFMLNIDKARRTIGRFGMDFAEAKRQLSVFLPRACLEHRDRYQRLTVCTPAH